MESFPKKVAALQTGFFYSGKQDQAIGKTYSFKIYSIDILNFKQVYAEAHHKRRAFRSAQESKSKTLFNNRAATYNELGTISHDFLKKEDSV